MTQKYFPIVSYAVQSGGPVLSGLMLDNGPALVMAHLLEAGYSPVFFDFNNVRSIREISEEGKERFLNNCVNELEDYIKSTGSKVIAFKVYANGVRDSIRIAEELKQRNKGLIIAGTGPQVAIFREEIFRFTAAFDVLVLGEGEATAIPLADFAYRNAPLSSVPNLIYKDDGDIKKTRIQYADLNELRFPVYSKEFYPSIGDKIFIPVVVDSKGCYYGKCSFCNHENLGGIYRSRKVEKLVEETEFNKKEHGIKVSRLSGNPSPKYLNELLRSLPEGQRISAFGKISMDYQFDVLADRLIGLFCGLESTDSRILAEIYGKTRNIEEYLSDANKLAHEMKGIGIPTIFSMIVPSPFETELSTQRSIDFIVNANPDFVPALPIGIFPNTALMQRAVNEGAKSGVLLDKDYMEKWMFFELDLLKPPQEWPVQPYEIVVNENLTRDIFGVTQRFLGALAEHGIRPLSDEIVLMAHLYYNGLSKSQDERRKQCIDFNNMCRKAIQEGDWRLLEEIKNSINNNQRSGD
ncbi:MAG TPA: hypothetical protein VJC00_01635 [Candidatus Nanoarchaeia archaeon]|nr:hypothetical protein [Candidatus Nanoarchaeia archaeon]